MDLIQRCRTGDEEAFAELFHRHKNLVYKILLANFGQLWHNLVDGVHALSKWRLDVAEAATAA